MSQRKLITYIFLIAFSCFLKTESSKSCNSLFSNSQDVESPGLTFKIAFDVALASNELLLKQFNVSLPPAECYKLNRKLSLDFYSKIPSKDPIRIANEIAEVSKYKYLGLPPKYMAGMVITSVQQILEKQGILNERNAIQLALKFVNYLNSLRDSPDYDGSPKSNLRSLFYGVLHLVQDVIPDSPNLGDLIAEKFVKNIRALPGRVALVPVIEFLL